MSDTDKFIEASRVARVTLLLLILFVFFSWNFVDYWLDSYKPGDDPTIQQLEQSNLELDRFNLVVIVITETMFLSFSLIFFSVSYRTYKSREYPPAGSRLLVRTKVIFGKQATRQAFSNLLAGVFCLGLGAFWLYLIF